MTKRKSKQKTQPQTYKSPTIQFHLMSQDWLRIAQACRNNNLDTISESIGRHIEGERPTELVTIPVPVKSCVGIAQACATHNLAVGAGFATAASSHQFKQPQAKPVPNVDLANAREELES